MVVVHDAVEEATQDFGDGKVGVVVGVAGFGDAVGVEVDAADGVQLFAADGDGQVQVGAQGVAGWAVQSAEPGERPCPSRASRTPGAGVVELEEWARSAVLER